MSANSSDHINLRMDRGGRSIMEDEVCPNTMNVTINILEQTQATGEASTEAPLDTDFRPCFTCNGFYAPSYEDPICPVCHSFLLINVTPQNVYQTCLPEEKDDDDSGNDEPEEDNDRSVEIQVAGNGVNHDVNLLQNNPDANNPPDQIRVVDIELLPPEVMMLTFSYLDDLSMWAAAEVNDRWQAIILRRVTTSYYWRKATKLRWPLFEIGGYIKSWFEVYSSLAKSCCCLKCLRQITLRRSPAEEESDCQFRQHRLDSELRTLKIDPPDGIKANPLDAMYCHWIATMKGPEGSPYEGGVFFLYIHIPYSYPMTPPVVRFITKIYHPNISRHGDIGIDSIQNNWSLALTICKVLISIQSLLTDPVCEICMEPKIGQIYLNDRMRYDDIARQWTWQFAMTQLVPH